MSITLSLPLFLVLGGALLPDALDVRLPLRLPLFLVLGRPLLPMTLGVSITLSLPLFLVLGGTPLSHALGVSLTLRLPLRLLLHSSAHSLLLCQHFTGPLSLGLTLPDRLPLTSGAVLSRVPLRLCLSLGIRHSGPTATLSSRLGRHRAAHNLYSSLEHFNHHSNTEKYAHNLTWPNIPGNNRSHPVFDLWYVYIHCLFTFALP